MIIFVSPAKHGRHIGIMSPSAAAASSASLLSAALLHFWFQIDNYGRDISFSLNFYRKIMHN